MKTLGELVREYRKANKLTLRMFGEKLGYSPSQVSDLQTGRRVPQKKELLEKLAEALELSFDEIKSYADYSYFASKLEENKNENGIDNKREKLKLARTVFDSDSLTTDKLRKIYDIIND